MTTCVRIREYHARVSICDLPAVVRARLDLAYRNRSIMCRYRPAVAYWRGCTFVQCELAASATVYPRGWPLYYNRVPESLPRVDVPRRRHTSGEHTEPGDDAGAHIDVIACTYGMSAVAIAALFVAPLRHIPRLGFGVWELYDGYHGFIDLTGKLPRMRLIGPHIRTYTATNVLFYQRHASVHACAHACTRRRRRYHIVIGWDATARACARVRMRGLYQRSPDSCVCVENHLLVDEFGIQAQSTFRHSTSILHVCVHAIPDPRCKTCAQLMRPER